MGLLQFKRTGCIFSGIDYKITMNEILRKLIQDNRRDTLMGEILVKLSIQDWIPNAMKQDAARLELWGFGIVRIFNTRPAANWPAAVINWEIPAGDWWAKNVKTSITYTDNAGNISASWTW